MSNLLTKLRANTSKKPIEPREIFMSLPQKDKQYEYPRDVQTEVWDKWFPSRNNPNTIIKMNTGSGKTVVGLIILQSCLNEGKGPAIYVVPDKYLVSQVLDEAKKLGITATDNRDDYQYSENRSILIMPIQALVNGKSVFGMRPTGNYPIGSILIDDVHSCLDSISNQFSIKIPVNHPLYRQMVSIFEERWKSYNALSYSNIIDSNDPIRSFLIPFWMWQESVNDTLTLLNKYNNDDDDNKNIFFHFPLLADQLSLCNCIITAKDIEIIPLGIAINKIKNFETAHRRIFMSATLADDSVFISDMGLHKESIANIITPDHANDIGDRLILFPRHLNSSITDKEIREKIFSLSKDYNVIVIVPSREQAHQWDSEDTYIVDRSNIESAVATIRGRKSGIAVFINRYDGIDLPDDACRLLVLDGLPPLRNEYDKYIQSIDSTSSILLREQIQRIEQGMGRGVRSNSDSCCVVLMGDNLADVLVRSKGYSYFSPATLEQYQLSKKLWDLLKEENDNPTIDDVFGLADYSLHRDLDWIQMSKESLSGIKYENAPNLNRISITLRQSYEYACSQQWSKAVQEIDSLISESFSDSTKGYLLQIKAIYCNFYDRVMAQQQQKVAHNLNSCLLCPLDGIRYQKAINNQQQSKNICNYAKAIATTSNEYVLYWDAVARILEFSDDADGFENAFQTTGRILGFISTRPDKETSGKGPDNLWALGDNTYWIIECKNGATATSISKNYCNQLGGSIRWFISEYGTECKMHPIMVHPSSIIDEKATPVNDMRIITPHNLQKLKSNITQFVTAFSQDNNWMDEGKTNILLQAYKLRRQDLIREYTTEFKKV